MATDRRKLLLQNPNTRLKVLLFPMFFLAYIYLTKHLHPDSRLIFPGGRSIKLAKVVAMVAAKKKLAPPLKKVVAAATTSTPSDAATAQITITLTVPGKMASIMPSLANTTTGPTVMGKRPRPSTRATVDAAQPSKRVKTNAKKMARGILIISSQDIRITTLETAYPFLDVEVLMGTLLDPLASIAKKMAILQRKAEPTVLVEQSTQNLAVNEPVIQTSVDPNSTQLLSA